MGWQVCLCGNVREAAAALVLLSAAQPRSQIVAKRAQRACDSIPAEAYLPSPPTLTRTPGGGPLDCLQARPDHPRYP